MKAPLTIAFAQLLPQSDQLALGEQACRDAAAHGADLIVFPEMWNDGYEIPQSEEALRALAVSGDGAFVTRFASLARELHMAVAITYLKEEQGKYFNTVTLFDQQGERVLDYSKVHICTFGDERMLTAGTRFPVTTLHTAKGDVRVGCMICFDREFPESARTLMLKGAELMLVPNACPMEVNRLSQLRARAFESMAAIATCNYPEGKPDCNGHSTLFNGIAFNDANDDMLVMEAGEKPGIYYGELDVDALRDYRQREVWGNAYYEA